MTGYTPLRAGAIGPMIERTYRDSGPEQWIREVVKNAVEAGAKNVKFDVEWQGVEASGVYRALAADDGGGMDTPDLRKFFSTFGGGGKPIGEAHLNFGIGVKTSCLPWNKAGLVVVSRQDGVDSMIRIEKMPDGEYGLRQELVEDEDGEVTLEDVYEPYFDEELGIDFASIFPDFIGDHGTVLLFLGNDLDQDTIEGDPRGNTGTTGVTRYLEHRFLDPEAMNVRILTLEGPNDLKDWPRKQPTSLTSKAGSKLRTRTSKGLIHYLRGGTQKGVPTESGVIDLGTGKARWYLHEKQGYAGGSYAPGPGGICVLLDGEVFYLSNHHARMRSFGITEREVQKRAWIVIEPPQHTESAYEADGHHFGVFMKGDRTSLAWGGDFLAHGLPEDEMPWADWADEFARQMPAAISEAVAKARASQQVEDTDMEDVRKRVKERLAARLNRLYRFIADPDGKHLVDVILLGPGKRQKRKPSDDPTQRDPTKKPRTRVVRKQGLLPGKTTATKVSVRHGLPGVQWKEPGEFEPEWVLAKFDRNGGKPDEAGLISLNKGHGVVLEAVTYHQERMVRQDEGTLDEVRQIVMDQFAALAVATVANSEQFRGRVTDTELNDNLRSDEALTMALVGMLSIDAMVGPRLGAVGGKQKAA